MFNIEPPVYTFVFDSKKTEAQQNPETNQKSLQERQKEMMHSEAKVMLLNELRDQFEARFPGRKVSLDDVSVANARSTLNWSEATNGFSENEFKLLVVLTAALQEKSEPVVQLRP